MDELKACPFCGSLSVMLDEPINPDSYAVFCNGKCGAVGPEDEDGEKAIEFWNARPLEDALQAEIARLREAQRWIPVGDSKSLNDLDLYLVTDGEIVSVGFYTTKWGTWTSADDLLLPFNVTHWMPLPQPPQEAEGN